MTTYSSIADSEIDPESPYTTGLATKMRNNPIAIAEGSSGAPKISLLAIGDPVISATGSQSITSAVPYVPTAGLYIFMADIADYNGLFFEAQISSTWRKISSYGTGASEGLLGFMVCDGTNMRINYTGGGSITVYYQKFN